MDVFFSTSNVPASWCFKASLFLGTPSFLRRSWRKASNNSHSMEVEVAVEDKGGKAGLAIQQYWAILLMKEILHQLIW